MSASQQRGVLLDLTRVSGPPMLAETAFSKYMSSKGLVSTVLREIRESGGKLEYEERVKNGRVARYYNEDMVFEYLQGAGVDVWLNPRFMKSREQEFLQEAQGLLDDLLFSHEDILALSRNPDSYAGIYFLIKGEEIVYVGRSNNVFSRLQVHLNDQDKVFDTWAFQLMTVETALMLERAYLLKFDPAYNQRPSGKRQEEESSGGSFGNLLEE